MLNWIMAFIVMLWLIVGCIKPSLSASKLFMFSLGALIMLVIALLVIK